MHFPPIDGLHLIPCFCEFSMTKKVNVLSLSFCWLSHWVVAVVVAVGKAMGLEGLIQALMAVMRTAK